MDYPVPYEPRFRSEYLAMEASASAPYTRFVYASAEQALSVSAALMDAEVGEFAPRYSLIAVTGGEAIAMMSCLKAKDVRRARMQAAMVLKRQGLFRDYPNVVTRTRIASDALWQLSEGDFYLARIAVSPKERKRGLASAMLADLFDRAKAAGATRVVLEVDKSDEATRRLYGKHGFEEVGVRRVTNEERALEYIHLQRTIVTN
jgi:ribosomal protein S18 acetylase RimI-like enzyme